MSRLPRGLAYALSILVARCAFTFATRARQRLQSNLAVVCPEASPEEIRELTWRNFRNHSKAYADLMRLPRMRVEDMRPWLHTQGEEHLHTAMALGKGVLTVAAHMGSWEIVAAIWSATVAPVSLFAEVLEPPEMYEWYRETRGRLGISVLPLNNRGLRQVVEALKANEMVVTALDRDIAGTGMEMEFFGRPTTISTGPAALSLRYGTPLLPVYVIRLPDDTYQAVGTPPLVGISTGNKEADIRALNEQVLRRLEDFIRAHPDQWHVPHVIWPADARAQSSPARIPASWGSR